MMTETPRPLPESYWVVPDRLLAGEYPGQFNEELTRKRIDALIEAGFNIFIDLTQPGERVPYTGILHEEAGLYDVNAAYHSFPIGDYGLPTPEQMHVILAAIDDGIRAGRKIYLHCWGGIGRTGTTVGCYLVRHGRTGVEALDQLAAWWQTVPKSREYPHSPETRSQMNFILGWAQHDRKLPK